jgi:voltage-gated potassium channel
MDPFRRLRQVVLLATAVVATVAGGTVGFHLIIGSESWFQSFYRSVITASLTGLDTIPPSDAARALSIVMAVCGLTIIGYSGAVIVEAISGGVLSGALAERRRQKLIEKLNDHFIICGYGRVGRRVAEEFLAAGVSYVVLDYREDALAAANAHHDVVIEGNGTQDEDLERAGLDRAKGLVIASDDDADNLYITLSARNTRPDLQIVVRASDEDAKRKLELAGADRVVMPYNAAGRTMANLVLKPQVTAFLDTVTTATGADLHLAEIEVDRTCQHAGKTIRDLRVRHETGAIIIALRKKDGSFDTTPEPDTSLEPGDVIVGVGTSEELRDLEDMFAVGS